MRWRCPQRRVGRACIGEHRGANIAKVAAGRTLLTLVYHWLRNRYIRSLPRPV